MSVIIVLNLFYVLHRLFSHSAASWLKPPAAKTARRLLPRYLTWRYVHNNYRKILFLVAFILINVALFAEAAYRYVNKGSNWCLITGEIKARTRSLRVRDRLLHAGSIGARHAMPASCSVRARRITARLTQDHQGGVSQRI